MANLDRQRLRKLIKLEMRKLMDEDALFMKRNIPGDYDHDVSNFRQTNPADDIYPYDDEDEMDSYDDSGCLPVARGHSPKTSYMQIRLDEGGGDCGCHSKNPYEEEREEDYGYDRNYKIDNAMQTLTNLGGDVDVDFDHDDHKHSSYMARPQLYKIAKYAAALLDMVDENEELDDWQESKIAQISQMIGSVYHSLDYDEEYDDHDDLDVHDLIGMIRTGNI